MLRQNCYAHLPGFIHQLLKRLLALIAVSRKKQQCRAMCWNSPATAGVFMKHALLHAKPSLPTKQQAQCLLLHTKQQAQCLLLHTKQQAQGLLLHTLQQAHCVLLHNPQQAQCLLLHTLQEAGTRNVAVTLFLTKERRVLLRAMSSSVSHTRVKRSLSAHPRGRHMSTAAQAKPSSQSYCLAGIDMCLHQTAVMLHLDWALQAVKALRAFYPPHGPSHVHYSNRQRQVMIKFRPLNSHIQLH